MVGLKSRQVARSVAGVVDKAWDSSRPDARLISVRSVVQLYPGPWSKSQSLTDLPVGEAFRVGLARPAAAEIVTKAMQWQLLRKLG